VRSPDPEVRVSDIRVEMVDSIGTLDDFQRMLSSSPPTEMELERDTNSRSSFKLTYSSCFRVD